jgi:uncharacterized protein YbjT (DUF2867 family)
MDLVNETIVITGAFSYTGRYATRMLLERGYGVRTLTGHSARANAFSGQVAAFPYNFEHPAALRKSLEGASTLINTYWVRFPRGELSFETAVRNSQTLIQAAADAGVRRIVHVSIANPSLESPLAYYRGKAQVEEAVRKSGLSHAIVRPTVIFGNEDILINNIAWFVRRLPIFGIPGDGQYGIRPIYVEDMARVLVDSVERSNSSTVDAVGPETFNFEELVRIIARELRSSIRIAHMPARLAYLATLVTGWAVRDVVLTWEEYLGLIGNLLAPSGPAAGATRLTEWLTANRENVGKNYASEVQRHFLKATPSHKA